MADENLHVRPADQILGPSAKELDGSKILVVGAGLAGLAVAMEASHYGAEVDVFERTRHPREDQEDPNIRYASFSLGLNDVGRNALREPRALTGGIPIIGRAIHTDVGQPKQRDFENGGHLTSIPRSELRRNLVALAAEKGASIRFNTKVIEIDPNHGSLVTNDRQTYSGDLLVVADGRSSVGDSIAEQKSGLTRNRAVLKYLTALLDPKVANAHGLSLEHIHFWRQKGSEAHAVGLPNRDGSIALSLTSRFADVTSQTHPFDSLDEARYQLEQDFPQLLAHDQDLPSQIYTSQLRHFYYKFISEFVLGKKAVVVGESGRVTPPPRGIPGANVALHSADVLLRFLIGHGGSIDAALADYQTHQDALSTVIKRQTGTRDDFPEGQRTKGSILGLSALIVQACEESSLNIPELPSA